MIMALTECLLTFTQIFAVQLKILKNRTFIRTGQDSIFFIKISRVSLFLFPAALGRQISSLWTFSGMLFSFGHMVH